MASTHAISTIRAKLEELESDVDRMKTNPTVHDESIIEELHSKAAFLRKLLDVETKSSFRKNSTKNTEIETIDAELEEFEDRLHSVEVYVQSLFLCECSHYQDEEVDREIQIEGDDTDYDYKSESVEDGTEVEVDEKILSQEESNDIDEFKERVEKIVIEVIEKMNMKKEKENNWSRRLVKIGAAVALAGCGYAVAVFTSAEESIHLVPT